MCLKGQVGQNGIGDSKKKKCIQLTAAVIVVLSGCYTLRDITDKPEANLALFCQGVKSKPEFME